MGLLYHGKRECQFPHEPAAAGQTKPEVNQMNDKNKQEKPISSVYPVIDTDLARDNVENDIPAADLQDL